MAAPPIGHTAVHVGCREVVITLFKPWTIARRNPRKNAMLAEENILKFGACNFVTNSEVFISRFNTLHDVEEDNVTEVEATNNDSSILIHDSLIETNANDGSNDEVVITDDRSNNEIVVSFEICTKFN